VLYVGRNAYWRVFQPVTLGARVILVRDGQVLLIRHSYRPGWFMPGGGIKRRETLEDAARREVREETGAEVGELRLLGFYDNFGERKSDHIAIYVPERFELVGRHDEEIAEVAFFPLDQLPEGVSRGTRARIEDYLAGRWGASGPW
jgi:8-oxo-dGTP pyrophosphatase MutT (NUDIX family)